MYASYPVEAPWAPTVEPVELDSETLGEMLDLVLGWNMRFLKSHRVPPIYEAGVRYIPEARGRERWRAIPHVLANGGSVCHSLSCWRAAELRIAGIDARPVWTVQTLPDETYLYHVRVYIPPCKLAPAGMIDDPSLRLGMNVEPADAGGFPWRVAA